ncbi:MAG: glycoside hydrolase family 127 protein, partial [Spirochaetales bacterium]|nr:glycoside hydrolase family 127 protein [Spirochaetales bacterium]
GWMNCNASGVHPGPLKQYLRTGEYKYFEFAENMTLHIMDVDTVHYNTVSNDKRLKKRISDDYSQIGSIHRHNADHWGGRNDQSSYTNLHGILLYYYMTGYERAFDVAKEIGEFFLKEKITYYKHPDIAPQRGISNLMWGLIELYEATGEKKYKDVADKWADVLFRGQRYDGTWGEDYNPVVRRWTEDSHSIYTLNYTLPALVAYHQITGNKAILDSIIRGVEYYMDKKPFNPFYEGLVYCYYLTGEEKFLKAVDERLNYHLAHQNKGQDPVNKGMFYQKAYYLRSVEFLYQLPFAFEAVRKSDDKR